ncbi:excisionase family DNA binding protein [Rhodoglobus vestalii]|uniref:Excisionase family DNA binding protein n=2 Tax=Rhodoglobus vestalii TaxID=193384 RepID=A0A8H2PWX5_9MICO|nr:excisionase family DNA binding protein [Rhodoglobus vestalii]
MQGLEALFVRRNGWQCRSQYVSTTTRNSVFTLRLSFLVLSVHLGRLMPDENYWMRFPQVLSVAEVAEITRVSSVTVWRLLNSSKIPAHRIADAWIIYKEEVQAWAESGAESSKVHSPTRFLEGYPEELTIEDLTVLLGKTQQTVYKWLAAGSLAPTGWRVGRKWLLHKSSFIVLLENSSNQHADFVGDGA